ncbi:MAG: transglycosylase domain-containing protein, partial [Pseudomonadota bacterium]
MARKSKNTRIEPTFEPSKRSKSGSGLRADASDRASPPARKSQKKATKSGSARRKQNKRKTTRKRGRLVGFFGKITYWCLVLGLWAGIGVAGIVGYYAVKLPQSASWTVPERPPNARIVSTQGTLIANRGATGGAAMRLGEMSPYIPMAVIAIEDRRFNSHFGFDPIGFTRAMVRNIVAGRLVQGGSTLTQQLAKNLFLEPERTLERKVQELILAVWMETKYSKDEILELYLNRVYFGSGAYGVDAASRRYFNKSARDVNLSEAAILAGLLKAPSKLSPAKNPELAEQRAQLVLAAMRRVDYITDSEAAKALTMQAKKAKRFWSGSEHYVADLVMKQLPALIGEFRQDVVVDTTIDLGLQRKAGEIVENTLKENGKSRKVSQGAMISMSPNGAIRALVGGREYADSQFNRVTDAKRQPGSAFKPIVYLAALEAGRTPESIRQDAPVRIGNWTPVNYDRKYRGPVSLNTALAKSLNTVAAQMVMEVGPQTVVETAHRLGVNSALQANASISLGTSEVSLMELTSAYAPFANGGRLVEPFVIRRVKDLKGNILYEHESFEAPVVVRSREVGMMNSMLSDVIMKGTGKAAKLGNREAAGKTGTSQKSRDGLFVGYTANLVTGVWYGNDDGSPTKKVTGGSLPAKTWQSFMKFAHEDMPLAELPGNYAPIMAAIPVNKPTTTGQGPQDFERKKVVRPVVPFPKGWTIPYIDTNPKGNGYYTFAERKFAITVYLFGFIIFWIVLITIGT